MLLLSFIFKQTPSKPKSLPVWPQKWSCTSLYEQHLVIKPGYRRAKCFWLICKEFSLFQNWSILVLLYFNFFKYYVFTLYFRVFPIMQWRIGKLTFVFIPKEDGQTRVSTSFTTRDGNRLRFNFFNLGWQIYHIKAIFCGFRYLFVLSI